MATTSATSATTGSNIDVAGIVSQLMTVEQRPLTALAKKEASYQAKLSAYGNIKGALAAFQSAMSGLSDISKFRSLTTTSSDNTVISGTAAATATAGTYTIDVTKLAQAQQLASAGQASNTASIGSGTLTFDFGTIAGGSFANGQYTGAAFTSNGGGTKTVTIGADNSLQGIRDAINNANIGVTATIINDGSATPYRLALTSNSVGASNSIKISVAESGPAGLAALLAHDPAGTQSLAENATAQNAEFKVNGIAVSKPSNTVTDVLQGVTLNLQKTSTTSIKLTVAQDTSAVQTAAKAFVKAYNDLRTLLQNTSSYDPATKQGGVLQGDATVRTLQSQVRAVLNTPLSSNGSITTLSQIGIAFQKDGSLALDTAKLNTAASNNFGDLAGLFAAVGKASDSLISYSSASSSTKPGSYAVNVTSLATQGATTGNVNLNAGPATIAAGTTINVNLDGATATVTLSAGTGYTAAQLAMMIQSSINGTSAFSSSGSAVTATIDASGFMHITSNRYGSASNVSVSNGAGTPASDFMGTTSNTTGADVVGSIGGATATGSGQYLTAAGGDATGLKMLVSGGTFGAGIAGARGTVTYSQGYAYTLNQLATTLLSSGGPLDGVVNGMNKSIASIGKQRDALNVRLAAMQKQYTRQFSALDVMLSSMNSTSAYLTQQLANLPKA